MRQWGAIQYLSYDVGTTYGIKRYDSKFNKVWEKTYRVDTNTLVPYYTLATQDKGCLVLLWIEKGFLTTQILFHQEKGHLTMFGYINMMQMVCLHQQKNRIRKCTCQANDLPQSSNF